MIKSALAKAARLALIAASAAGALSAISVVAAPKAFAANPTYRTTDDVGRRPAPTAKPNGQYGIPKGASFVVQCQVLGEPHGSRGNKLYFLTNYNGQTYVPDAWTDSPHMAADPPIAGIPMCGSSSPTPAPQPAPGVPSSGTYISGAVAARPCVNTGNGNCNAIETTGANSAATMLCYQDGSTATGAYSSARWFLMRLANGHEAFVHSSYVQRQVSVGRCTDQIRNKAADWAIAQIGQRTAPEADAARYNDWTPGPRGEWSGDCIKLANAAWVNAGGNTFRGNAIDVYNQYNRAGRIRKDANPPRGALVFWNVTSAGHVAVAIGGDRVVGTQGMDKDNKPVALYSIGTYPNYLGWAMP